VQIRVIGVGSDAGDDAAGLAVVDWLAAQRRPACVSLARCERPLPDLVDALDGADAAIVVDAARGGGAPGVVRRLDEAAIADAHSPSSHGFGARRAVALARALGRAPRRLVWLAISIDSARPGEGLSPAVREAVPEAGRRALEEARRIGDLGAEGSADA
jgi:hydrogenase maturation protease